MDPSNSIMGCTVLEYIGQLSVERAIVPFGTQDQVEWSAP